MTHDEPDRVRAGRAAPVATQNEPSTAAAGGLVYGYLCAGDGPIDELPVLREAIITTAERLGFLLARTYTDYSSAPSSTRPALRQLMNAARALRPRAVLVPGAWHLSQSPTERTAVLDQFRQRGCQVIAVEDGTASVLNAGDV
ncbi:hypothetical protein ALI22I_07770 [Saccharothrix sp. ALI-22-I]|uniref:recombinase family protein n=1 Tax=Saccharothrix sp. ALI-22-I TaxID=1933778 RepID=UPI00097C3792|nr:recombinase family protein [Saccharothrix sp. ALI-22-I]ONI91752.1 hypothetical protein ALI22I_07770 [Saccharothrix sp. ALI-22-I]